MRHVAMALQKTDYLDGELIGLVHRRKAWWMLEYRSVTL